MISLHITKYVHWKTVKQTLKAFLNIFKMPGLRLQNPIQETHQAAHRFRRPIVVNILQDDSPFEINLS